VGGGGGSAVCHRVEAPRVVRSELASVTTRVARHALPGPVGASNGICAGFSICGVFFSSRRQKCGPKLLGEGCGGTARPAPHWSAIPLVFRSQSRPAAVLVLQQYTRVEMISFVAIKRANDVERKHLTTLRVWRASLLSPRHAAEFALARQIHPVRPGFHSAERLAEPSAISKWSPTAPKYCHLNRFPARPAACQGLPARSVCASEATASVGVRSWRVVICDLLLPTDSARRAVCLPRPRRSRRGFA